MTRPFDFSKPLTDPKKNFARYSFEYRVLYARQLIYDLADGCAAQDHAVVRHPELEGSFARHKVAVSIGVVYLVRELDGLLNLAFRDLWQHRPDLLQGWASRRIRSEDEPTKPLVLNISFDDLWKPSTKRLALDEFFRSRVLSEWFRTSGMEKIEGIQDILLGPKLRTEKDEDRDSGRKAGGSKKKVRPGELPAKTLDTIRKGVEYRNSFVHPGTNDYSTSGKPSGLRDSDARGDEAIDFDGFAEALLEFAEWLQARVRPVSQQWIATNIPYLPKMLTDRQNAAFGLMTEFQAGSGRRYTSFEHLVETVEDFKKRGDAGPQCYVLGTQKEVMTKLAQIRKYVADHEDVKLVLFEDPYGVTIGHGESDPDRKSLLGMESEFRGRVWFVPRYKFVPDPTKELLQRVKPDPSFEFEEALRGAIKAAAGR
ncbi:MAG: hypothetical protein IT452_04330 [Planctomycetia bacterium]|nr:hypothetical protein [Planctomycetia bacterium]